MPTRLNNLPDLLLARPARATLLLLLIAGSVEARDADRVIVTPPVMVSVGADTPTWETTAELIAAAHEGDPDASFHYAQLLEIGDQVERDKRAAFRFYQQAATRGQPNALFRVGKVLHDGLLGQVTDRPTAFEYYQKAALAEIPEATHNVGAMLVSGRGVKRNYTEGLAWLIVAAEQGADARSVEIVRERIKSRPEWIARAEERADEIRREIAETTPGDLVRGAPEPEPDLAPNIAAPSNPIIAAPTIGAPALPGLSPTAPKTSISAPTISIPQPEPQPTPPETTGQAD